MEAQDGEPELVVPLQDQHHPVAPFNAQGLEVVGGPGRFLFHIGEGKPALAHILAHMEHGQLLRFAPPQLVDHVEGEVEALLVLERDGEEPPVLVLLREDEVLIDAALFVPFPRGPVRQDALGGTRSGRGRRRGLRTMA